MIGNVNRSSRNLSHLSRITQYKLVPPEAAQLEVEFVQQCQLNAVTRTDVLWFLGPQGNKYLPLCPTQSFCFVCFALFSEKKFLRRAPPAPSHVWKSEHQMWLQIRTRDSRYFPCLNPLAAFSKHILHLKSSMLLHSPLQKELDPRPASAHYAKLSYFNFHMIMKLIILWRENEWHPTLLGIQ